MLAKYCLETKCNREGNEVKEMKTMQAKNAETNEIK